MGREIIIEDTGSAAEGAERRKASTREEKSITGLNVLQASEATEEAEWPTIRERDKTKRLREAYWIRQAESHVRSPKFFGLRCKWECDRGDIERRSDDPGDGFAYLAMASIEGMEIGFEWFEVTEVFTTAPPEQVKAAMQAWNGLSGKKPEELEGFLADLDRRRPSRAAQRRAADCVIAQVRKKLAKSSYKELFEKYGYGTLVVGMPLWFATPPMNLLRAENALDEFDTRTKLGLEEVRRVELERKDCPFKQVIVLWESTLEAMQEWVEERSSVYDDVAKLGLVNRLMISGIDAALEYEPESVSFHATVKAKTKRPSMGPYSDTGNRLQELAREQEQVRPGSREKTKRRIALFYLKLYYIVQFVGVRGLRRLIVDRFSISRFLKANMTALRARRLYGESIRRSGSERGQFRGTSLVRRAR